MDILWSSFLTIKYSLTYVGLYPLYLATMPEQLTKESIMKQQLLAKLKDIKNKSEKDYDNLMKTYLFDWYDSEDRSHAERLSERSDTIDEIIKIVEKICPYDEPLHNHHDGCPLCSYV